MSALPIPNNEEKVKLYFFRMGKDHFNSPGL